MTVKPSLYNNLYFPYEISLATQRSLFSTWKQFLWLVFSKIQRCNLCWREAVGM